MPKHELTRVSKYSARQMFDMAADVAAYDQFLPLVKDSSIFDLQDEIDGILKFKGRLQVAKESLGIAETFTSDVTADKNKLSIISTSTSGPVKKLINTWQFVDLPGGGSQSRLVLDYEVSNLPMRMLMKASSSILMEKLTQAFEKRAKQLYG